MRRLHQMLSHLTLKTSVFITQLLPSLYFAVLKTVFRSLASVISRVYDNRNSQISPLVFSLVNGNRLLPTTFLTAVVTNFPAAIYLPCCFCFTTIALPSQQQFFDMATQWTHTDKTQKTRKSQKAFIHTQGFNNQVLAFSNLHTKEITSWKFKNTF